MATYPLLLDTKLAASMKAYTYAEFLAATTLNRDLLIMRGQEARVDPKTQVFFAAFPDVLHWVVLVSEDAPETAVLLPFLARLAACTVCFDLRIVCEGDGFGELSAWLDECGAADVLNDPDLPLLLLFDEEWQLQDQWGPFPQAMEPYLDEWLERHPDYETLADDESPAAQAEYTRLLEQLVWEMRVWFNSGLDYASAQELGDLLRGLVDEEAGESLGAGNDDRQDDGAGEDG